MGHALSLLLDLGLLRPGGTHTVDSVARLVQGNLTGLALMKERGRQPYPFLAAVLDQIAPVDHRYRRTNNDLYKFLKDARWAGRPVVPDDDAIEADAAERGRLLEEWKSKQPASPGTGPQLRTTAPPPCDPPVRVIGAG